MFIKTSKSHIRGLLFLATLALPGAAAAQGQSGASRAVPQNGSNAAEAVRVDHPPKLDGRLDDPLWQSAKVVTDFRQREPNEGETATEKTEVRILYTRHEVYFGIHCYDSESSGIVATELRRDVSQNLDDHFEILIDSNHDRRGAYVCQINPLGTQMDGLIVEEQGSGENSDFDSGWDGVWISEARVTSDGWTATVEIPFTTLNFTQSRNVIWGLNFKRFIRRKNEQDLWSAWKRTFGISKVSQAGELRGLNEINSGRLLIIKPYALAGFRHIPSSAASAGLTPGTSRLLTGGLDLKIGVRSNLVANLTGNTDFADADVDIQQFNLTPFKLFFPEKRQFFLENAGIFEFPTQSGDLLFFSRQIGIDPVSGQQVPINGGAKVTGTLAGFDVGIMDVDTRSNGPNPYANYAVVRVKRSLPGGSYIGIMGIDKRSGNMSDPFNQTGGVDARLVFFKNLVLTGYAAQTRSPSVSGGQTNVGGEFNYRSNWLEVDYAHKKIGPNFNPEVGFIERTDSNSDFVDVNLKPRPKIRGVRELNFEGF